MKNSTVRRLNGKIQSIIPVKPEIYGECDSVTEEQEAEYEINLPLFINCMNKGDTYLPGGYGPLSIEDIEEMKKYYFSGTIKGLTVYPWIFTPKQIKLYDKYWWYRVYCDIRKWILG